MSLWFPLYASVAMRAAGHFVAHERAVVWCALPLWECIKMAMLTGVNSLCRTDSPEAALKPELKVPQ